MKTTRDPSAGRGRGARGRPPADGIPLLRYGQDDNYCSFRERIIVAALERYKNLGRCIETGDYYVPPEVKQSDYDLTNDPYGVNKLRLQKAHEDRDKAIRSMNEDKPSLFSFIMSKLSQNSKEVVTHHKGWDTCNQEKRPLELWKIITATHNSRQGRYKEGKSTPLYAWTVSRRYTSSMNDSDISSSHVKPPHRQSRDWDRFFI